MSRQRFLIPSKDKSAQIGSSSAQTEICGQINVNCRHQKCIFQGLIPVSLNGRKNILHESIFLSQELYHGHCKVASYSSQSVALLPSSMKTLRQRYLQAFTGTTSSENLQGGEQKNTRVSAHSHKACPKWNY